ncbi:ABC transporter substrate-binding protein [Corynebacterium gerontici]|uniref:Maltose-binding periplasmic protein n=1 Tax=Corynebacterium gerontici TaxID=2079234 RepID=A0A3G6J2A1_9CORY|nr:ABC transporter substrate-binding protein [Corynebacterium gerontici]AZA12079.1 Maltose-binding periplasmic protein precursor [Corynebacterium gerontici]
MNTRKFVRIAAALMFSTSSLVACSTTDETPSVYFLNFKPEQDAAYKKIAEEYTDETGVPVKVVTAASGTYEQTLKAEVGKSEKPTLFQVNGPTGMHTWEAFMSDMSQTKMAKNLNDDVEPLKNEEGKTLGVPFAVEGFGILYNEDIFNKYASLPGAKIQNPKEIDSFDKLKAVAKDMQAKKDKLGIDGAFASTSLASGEDWRWQTHLANGPMHFEFEDAGTKDLVEAEFKYSEQFKNLFDLYLDNSVVERNLAPAKNVSDSMAEFAQGKAAMVQNGNWAWSQISDVSGNVVKRDKIKFMPMYMGLPDEAKYGLNIGTENYLTINAKASEIDQKATKDFVDWLFFSDAGKKHVVEDLGFIAPFKNYSEADTPDDPLAQQIAQGIADNNRKSIPWDFQYFPSQQFKNDFGQDLAAYASGTLSWEDVVENFKQSWEIEKAM